MSCLICAGAAQSVEAGETLEERICPRCGHYRMCTRLVRNLMEEGQIFDVQCMRNWLAERRVAGAIPVIEANDARLVG